MRVSNLVASHNVMRDFGFGLNLRFGVLDLDGTIAASVSHSTFQSNGPRPGTEDLVQPESTGADVAFYAVQAHSGLDMDVIVNDCHFEDSRWGAVYAKGASTATASRTHVLVANSTAVTVRIRGVVVTTRSVAVVRNVSVSRCLGGGFQAQYGSSLTVEDSLVHATSANHAGAAVLCHALDECLVLRSSFVDCATLAQQSDHAIVNTPSAGAIGVYNTRSVVVRDVDMLRPLNLVGGGGGMAVTKLDSLELTNVSM